MAPSSLRLALAIFGAAGVATISQPALHLFRSNTNLALQWLGGFAFWNVLGWTIGLAWHSHSVERGHTSVHRYWVPAAILFFFAGVARSLFYLAASGYVTHIPPLNVLRGALTGGLYLAIGAALLGVVFWLIHRPDRGSEDANATTSPWSTRSRTVAAIFGAAAVGAISHYVIYLASTGATAQGDIINLHLAVIFAILLFVAATFGLVFHAIAMKARAVQAYWYALGGWLIGGGLGFCFLAMLQSLGRALGGGRSSTNEFAVLFPLWALFCATGIISALTAWVIRRPDRDLPSPNTPTP